MTVFAKRRPSHCRPHTYLLVAWLASACGPQGFIQNATFIASETDHSGTVSSPTPQGPTSAGNALVQGGNGWQGDVNVAKTSKDYLALTLDQLKASGSELARELGEKPEVEAAIRKVATETGVPNGLLAGLCYQESSFDPTSVSNNPNPTPDDPRDVGLTQAPEPDFANAAAWQDPYTNIHLFVTKYFLPSYQQHQSWGVALRLWNSGQVLDENDLRKENNNTDPNYIMEILGTHCLGKD